MKRFNTKQSLLVLFMGTVAGIMVLAGLAGIRVIRLGRANSALHISAGEPAGSEIRLPSDAVPPFEIFPEEEALEPEWESLPKVPPRKRPPHIAIIIDDLGYDRQRAQAFIDLGFPLTFSLLPHSPFERTIAETAAATHNEVMLHIPMEPVEYPRMDPGPGALLVDMTPENFVRQLVEDLETLPNVKGVNNHMGSALTSDYDKMIMLFTVLKERGLFFVDSRTTSKSAAGQAARAIGLDFTRRDVFLDHVPQAKSIEKQLDRLLAYARRHGTAVGIAHPNRVTYRVLRDRLPGLAEQAVLVPVSRTGRGKRFGNARPRCSTAVFGSKIPPRPLRALSKKYTRVLGKSLTLSHLEFK
ncbi:MAG: divergent polysaccharide deacetylase family protein [Deltaproteobacteria bacterium]|nr:divergent polysaccharide deacetylase family protein [Deltaproteobacteria bacterium]